MKKLVWIAAAFITLSAAAVNDNPVVNAKVQETFKMVFANAENVTWSSAKDNNEASFSMNNVKVRAVIDNDGRLVRTIRYYGEEHLPAVIRYSVKKRFRNQSISNVSELSANDEVTYYVSLKDEQHLINVVVSSNGQVLTSKKYKRGDL